MPNPNLNPYPNPNLNPYPNPTYCVNFKRYFHKNK